MNQSQADIVQTTFERIARFGPHAAATFYAELFAIEPTLKDLFTGDMIAQGEKLMNMLAHAVAGLSTPETIVPVLRELAARHLDYNVEARHYQVVGTALMRTLRHELGADFTPEARAAWAAAYQFISDFMLEAAYGKAATFAP